MNKHHVVDASGPHPTFRLKSFGSHAAAEAFRVSRVDRLVGRLNAARKRAFKAGDAFRELATKREFNRNFKIETDE